MRRPIPAPVIAALSDVLPEVETHAGLTSLFLHAGAPGDPPEGNKQIKVQEWLRRVNRDESVNPLEVLGLLIEPVMEADCDAPVTGHPKRERKTRLEEFARALRNVEANPREAVSAGCNILESVCKIYIQEEGLEAPAKQDLQGIWRAVRKNLGFDPSAVEDRDLKEILSGLLGVVSGIGALRTHASSAHGAGRPKYRLEPRHARLAVHAAHTVVAFVLESWEEKKQRQSK